MVVQRHADIEFAGQLVDDVVGRGLGHQDLDAHFLGPFEPFAGLLLVRGQAVHTEGDQLETTGVGQFLLDLGDALVAHVGANPGVGIGLELLAGKRLQVLDAQAGGYVHGLEEAQPVVGPALQR